MTASGGGKKGNVGQGVLVLLILLLGVGGAGFAVGFTQKFAPIEMVAPDMGAASTTPGAADAGTAGGAGAGTPQSGQKLTKAYWLSTNGWDRAGYAIKVYINDALVGNFSTTERLEDISKYVKPGDNKVRFEAKALPSANRNDYTGSYLTVKINQGQKFSAKGYKDGSVLVEYTRKVTETDNFDDTMDFAVVE